MNDLAARRAQDETPEPGYSAEVIAEVKAKHPNQDLRQIVTEEGDAIIVKTPNKGEYKRFRAFAVDPAKKDIAVETLLYGCLVHPSPQELGAMLERRPAYSDLFGNILVGYAGAGQETTEKKL